MKSNELYNKLENDFIFEWITDDWWFLNLDKIPQTTENYKKRFMWIVFDFSENIDSVYTAVFPSDKVINEIIEKNIRNSMLFVHHPASWDPRRENSAFKNIPESLIEKMENNKISLYNLHSPLDNYSDFATSKTFCEALLLDEMWKFVNYEWWIVWIIANHSFSNLEELKLHFSKILWHQVWMIINWENDISWKKIWVVAGWWVDMCVMEEMKINNLETLITWVSFKNSFTEEALYFAKNNGINILSWTHYSTEKFACIKMVKYFKELWLKSEFIEDEPIFEDF